MSYTINLTLKIFHGMSYACFVELFAEFFELQAAVQSIHNNFQPYLLTFQFSQLEYCYENFEVFNLIENFYSYYTSEQLTCNMYFQNIATDTFWAQNVIMCTMTTACQLDCLVTL